MKKYILLSSILILTGCSIKTHQLNSYSLSANIDAKAYKHYNSVLMVKYPSSLGALGSNKIYYKRDGLTSYYLYSNWNQSLNRMLYTQIYKNLSKAKIFKSVIGYDSSANADLVLELEIVDFYHIIKENTSFADIAFNIKLINSQNGKIVKDKMFKYKINVEELNAKGFIKASQKAIDIFIKELIKTL